MNTPRPRWRPALWRTDAEDDHPSLWMEMLDVALSSLSWAAVVILGMFILHYLIA